MTEARIKIELDDGSGCYVSVVPVTQFDGYNVARAAGEAVALFIHSFIRDEVERGGRVWDPEAWKAKVDEHFASLNRK